ncbi:hypothetical protein [Lacrimispora sp.]|uniref:hypothetical protein n=1 Tax=Lacrimispora sp. TaxID=2719234 RepID=UPI002F3E2D5A
MNTSSLKDLMPSKEILKRYLQSGVRILTIGSDSHKMEHLGDHIGEVKEILKDIGFK